MLYMYDCLFFHVKRVIVLLGEFCDSPCQRGTLLMEVVQQLTVDTSGLELSDMNTVLKQEVNLAKSAAFGFWKSEPAPYITEQVGACVEEGGFGSPVAC